MVTEVGKGLSSWGNEFPNLNNYKYNRLFDYKQVGVFIN